MFLLGRAQASTRARTEGGESFFVDDVDLAASFIANERCEPALVTHDARISDGAAGAVMPPPLRAVDAWSSFDDELPKRFYQRDQEDSSCVEFKIDAETIISGNVTWGYHRTGLRELMLTGPTIRGVHLRETAGGSVVEPDANPNEEIH